MLSRKKPAVGPGSGNTVSSAKDSKKKRKLPKLEDFLQMRDYTGASTLLEVMSVVVLVLQGEWCFYYLGPWGFRVVGLFQGEFGFFIQGSCNLFSKIAQRKYAH